MNPTTQPPIVYEAEAITAEQVAVFNTATHGHLKVPLTFFTRFRKAEFEWLDRVKVNMKELLHTEQEFIYLAPLKMGDRPRITTKIVDVRSRRTMTFYELLTEVECNGTLVVQSHTHFLIRSTHKEANAAG